MDLRTFFFTSVSGTIYIPVFVGLIQRFIKALSGKYTFKLAAPITTTELTEYKWVKCNSSIIIYMMKKCVNI
ncbi:hypothetical protein [Clostridium sp. C8-1-8]|uniref:hypothetical protein n=1 Tax=Clostridium sp. C8-1-8 TaxID=2698831 RepID=UPI001370FCAC|nr:hypothetical protein [Clostridium sp. C8-1-8]